MAKEQTPPEVIARMDALMKYSTVRGSANGSDVVWLMGWEIDALDMPRAAALIGGGQSFGLNFGGAFFGEGVIVKESSSAADSEDVARAKVKVSVPPVGSKGNQIALYSGRANSMVHETGKLEFIEEQMLFDLTKKADDGLLPDDEIE